MDHSPRHRATSAGQAADVHGRAVLGLLTELITLWSSPSFQRDLFGSDNAGSDGGGEGQVGDLQSSRVLYRLALEGPCTPSRLSVELGTSRSNTSKVCGRLQAAGLVSRQRDDHDGRAVAVALTTAGTRAAARLLAASDQMMATVLTGWSVQDRAQLARLLSALTTAAHAHADHLKDDGADGTAEQVGDGRTMA